ncbi:non-specific lipid-transfer protein A-like [Wolffia australiana]
MAAAALLAALPSAAVSCGDVASNVGQCMPFLRGQSAAPPGGCCDGVRRLAAMAPAAADRRAACYCIKQAAAQASDIRANAVSSLPGICGVSLSFPISPAVDCARSCFCSCFRFF